LEEWGGLIGAWVRIDLAFLDLDIGSLIGNKKKFTFVPLEYLLVRGILSLNRAGIKPKQSLSERLASILFLPCRQSD
jgi:hypothetical protein